ncbi:MAG: ABC transporter ATP-binding protein [Lachnospiraceae bacterium]|nr:ABC transporter ATP-binding protein [Lachnospiraceae bacterium]MDD3660509.1 ABC transporter ATP-binding protein [Lachnospiraceae bacterium]
MSIININDKVRDHNKRAGILYLLQHLKKYKILLLFSVVSAFLSVGLSLYIPVVIGRAVDSILESDGSARLLSLLLQIMTATLVIALMQWCMSLCNNRVCYLTSKELRVKAFDHLTHITVSDADKLSTGDLVSRMTNDIDQLTDGLLLFFSQFFTSILTIIGTLLFMFMIHPMITMIVVVMTPVSFLIASYISKKSFLLFKDQSVKKGELTDYIEETIFGIKTLQSYQAQERSMEHFKSLNQSLKKTSEEVTFISSLTNPLTRFVNGLIYAVVGIGGAFLALRGVISIGSLTAFLSYASQYTKPFNEISGVITELQNAYASISRIYEFINDNQLEEESDGTLLSPVNGNIEFRHVSFSYQKEKKLIQDLNLSVSTGQRIAIVGPTGAGKSTLINLLMRFYSVDEGTILLDGYNIDQLNYNDLRKQYGMVLQEIWLKKGTIAENIAYGRPDATINEIQDAARRARADHFIEQLPKGYDTELDEDAIKLSLGQKQLLCIARVMLLNTTMMILDEATSSIDARTEILIQKAFLEMMKGRTSFIVAHRLSTIKEADLILVMKDGEIIEKGNHSELIERKGFYYQLFKAQYMGQERG